MGQFKEFDVRMMEIEEQVKKLSKRVDKIDGADEILVELFSRQSGWTSAPSPQHSIGPKGRFGEKDATLALEAGKYVYLHSYGVDTVDFGRVRWLQIRCEYGDPTHTSDGFAWIPVDPYLVNAESLYEDLKHDNTVQVDEYTNRVWEHMKSS